MIQTHTQRPLAGTLRARINKLAHTQALQHEIRLKTSLTEQVKSARNDGASFDELSALVDKLEGEPPGGEGRLQSSALIETGNHPVSHAEKKFPI